MKSRLHPHSFMNGLSGPPCKDTPDSCLASVTFLSHGALPCILDNKDRTTQVKLPRFAV